ncbi:MAG: alanine--tRNA ligase [Bacteroidota bacterium]|jgi:alanyl-tRNA synthetase
MTSNEIRQAFLDFFRSKGHTIMPSAPIVVKDDPTLMFTNAGMNQFKDYFLGNKVPPYGRVADTQKCLRVSGKHNDLEEVGVDTYHHTMFEMLGNWSFGDYFKREAISWSWELLTQVYRIPVDRLYATVFEGDEKEKLPASKVALEKWKEILPDPLQIVFGNKKDNFWEMGDTGPCGPCSEIHVDLRPDAERSQVPGHLLVNKDHPQVIEIWNNVFIQFNRKKDGSLEPLPAAHVDTGMGLERLVRVLQGKTSNYDTDIFSGTITEVERITGRTYDRGDSKQAIAFRVLADHIRAICFTIADGQLPSNTGAGYVIRRILRRAVRYYFSYLEYKHPLLVQLVPVLARQFEQVFPELQLQVDFVSKVVREEEEAFLRTLDKGLRRITEHMHAAGNSISGKVAFELYDTYGFPLDLTRLIASENGYTVDEKAFEEEMRQQKDRSRAATVIDAQDWVLLQEGSNRFVGYDSLESDTRVLKYRTVKIKGKESCQVVLETTPFYAESGGQTGDRGWLRFGDTTVEVLDTKKDNDLIIHVTATMPGKPDGPVLAAVNPVFRKETTRHHSATHLLHAALRQVLGTHVAQKGSLVNAEHLRFDFSHFAKVTAEELLAIEGLVNEKIRENVPVVIKSLPKEEALRLGAMALFGEKYGDTVRVVIMDSSYSVELCGGTHVGYTGELGLFKFVSESAVAAGVRRVEAVCGKRAEDHVNSEMALLQQLRESFRNPRDLVKAAEGLQEENSALRRQLEAMEARQLADIRADLLQRKETVNGIAFISALVELANPEALKKLCFDLRQQAPDLVAVLCMVSVGKPHVAVGISDAVAASRSLDAGKIIREQVAPLIKGGGGGQKTLATAGGQEPAGLQQAIDAVRGLL